MKRLSIEQKDPIAALEDITSSAALEDFNLRNITNRVMDAIPNLAHQAKQVLTRVTLPSNKTINYLYNEKVLEKAMKELEYLKIAEIKVYVPKGFSGSLSEYIGILNGAVDFTADTVARLTIYNQFLSALISHPDSRSSASEYITALADRDKARTGITESLALYFTEKNATDRAKFGEVFTRSQDVLDVMKNTGAIVDKIGKDDAKQLHKLVGDCLELLDAVKDAAKANQLSNMSPEIFKNLGSATLSMARDVELVGAVHFAVQQLAIANMANSKQLIDIIRYQDE